MKSERLLRILGMLDEDLVEEAESAMLSHGRGKHTLVKWMAAAACALLLVGAATLFPRMGGNSPGGGGLSGGGATGGMDGGTTFMRYAGPILPLSVLEDPEGITAERHIALDFTGLDEEDYLHGRDAQVLDKYTLHNESGTDRTVTLIYPFVSSVNDSAAYTPALSINGKPLETELKLGGYAGRFAGVDGDNGVHGETMNLRLPREFEDYKALLGGGEYFAEALADAALPNMTATVYTFTDVTYPEGYDAATLQISFVLPEGSMAMSYGMNGLRFDDETGEYAFSYFVLHPDNQQVIILGEPPADYALQGFVNGGCEEELAGISAQVTLESVPLQEAVQACMGYYSHSYAGELPVQAENWLAYRAVASMFAYTALGNVPADRYDWLRLEDLISEAYSVDRVQYLLANATIPAGGSAEIACSMKKGPSFDYAGAGPRENRDVLGYDVAASLASAFAFDTLTASLALPDGYTIVRENFGFGTRGNTEEVVLDPAQERYYIELRKADPQR